MLHGYHLKIYSEAFIMIAVEKATLADCPHIAMIHSACWSEVYHFIPEEVHRLRSVEYRRDQWVNVLETARYGDALFVLKKHDRVVGFAYSKASEEEGFPARGELHAAYILKAHRGGATGPMLMSAMVRSLISFDLAPVSLWAFKENKMKHAYRALGWEPVLHRDRDLLGYKVPETGYIHPDLDLLLKRLDRLTARYEADKGGATSPSSV
jgi:GNAT superfamily N-acetyltransferase